MSGQDCRKRWRPEVHVKQDLQPQIIGWICKLEPGAEECGEMSKHEQVRPQWELRRAGLTVQPWEEARAWSDWEAQRALGRPCTQLPEMIR